MRPRKRRQAEVAIVQNFDESAALMEALTLLRAQELVSPEDVVVITPNWVKKMQPESGVVVGSETLRTLIQFIKKLNPKRLVVASGSGGDKTPDAMRESGAEPILKEEGVEFIDLNHGPYIRLDLEHDSPNSTLVNKLYEEMTCLISFTLPII
ncbi:MAG: DUF362 domain-containing protein, partial [Clostridia bacterium]|nr:DUF362 domain-containing protein [Clostridia bacterium]